MDDVFDSYRVYQLNVGCKPAVRMVIVGGAAHDELDLSVNGGTRSDILEVSPNEELPMEKSLRLDDLYDQMESLPDPLYIDMG